MDMHRSQTPDESVDHYEGHRPDRQRAGAIHRVLG
jgi:hypothetical protein